MLKRTKRPPVTVTNTDDYYSQIAQTARLIWASQENRKRVGNHLFALEKDGIVGDFMESHRNALKAFEQEERWHEAKLEVLMKMHPLAEFVKEAPGIGLLGFGKLLACTGTLANFANPAKMWAFSGMAVRDGRAPKRKAGDRANWSPRARVVCYQLGEAIVKVGRGRYREAYDTKRSEYLARPGIGASGCPFGQEHSGYERAHDDKTGWKRKTGESRVIPCVKEHPDGSKSSAHVHAAARRFAVKLFLKDAWNEWQRVGGRGKPEH